MRSDFGNYNEEKIQGKSYDLKLLGRLFPFIKPYKMVFFLSVLLMMLIAVLDLSIPYMTKIAIDRYIVPVSDTDAGKTETMEQGQTQVLRLDADDQDIIQIVSQHPELFVRKQDIVEIDAASFKQLSLEERTRLRSDDINGLGVIACCMIFIVLLNFLFTFVQKLVMEIAGQKIMHDLRMYLFNHIQASPVSFFNANPVGRLVTRIINDVQNLHELFTSVIIFLFKDFFLIAGIAIVLSVISWRLALISFTVLPFVIFASFYFARHARDVFRDLRLKVSQINTRFSETIQGIKVIQLFRHEKRNEARFRELNHDNYQAGMRQIHIFAVFMPVIEVLGATALAVIIYYGGSGVISETITLGSLVAFISYMKMFFRPVRDIADKFNIIQNSMASAERIFLILDEEDSLEHDVAETSFPLLKSEPIQSVEFSDVDFSYTPGMPVLQNISFRVNKGETIAVVGPSGAGKTSLINLFIRFYDAEKGDILINGKNINTMDKRAVRSRMALVNQDPFLFSGSIRENILSGNPAGDEYSLDEILGIANCRSFVDKLPDGVDTRLSEGAATLSSGERQLISIARAVASNPDLIILDEATSYIDTESEVKIQGALDNLMADKTSVIIAHRLSTAKHADTILVMNKGQIIEAGDHETLMGNRSLYWKLTKVHSAELP